MLNSSQNRWSLLNGKAAYEGKEPDFIKEKSVYTNGEQFFKKEIKFIKNNVSTFYKNCFQ